MKVFQFLLIALLFALLFSCDKNENSPEDNPAPIPEPEFQVPETVDIIMYEVNLRAFSSTGDIQGIIHRLNQIKSLGVNVIWLMPIHPIGLINSVNSPYSVKNYLEVSSEYGTMDDLKTLISQAHKKGIAVILDWVANHTAWDNPWISNKEWYTQDGNGNIISPPGTNWMDVADLNYNNLEMRLKMIEAMEYWITTADIDGFRCDAADMVPFDFWKQAIDSFAGFIEKDLILLAEGARNDHFTAGFDMNFSWDFYSRLKEVFNGTSPPGVLYAIHNSNYNNMPAGKQKLRFTTNHDESAWDATPMVLFNGKSGALAASVITIFLDGVPLIYNGQEVGVVENIPFFSNSPINWSLNPDMLEEYKEILNFYSSSEVVKTSELTTYDHSSIVVFTLGSGQDIVLVIVNTRNSDITYSMPAELANNSWIDALSEDLVTINDQLDLTPYEYHILINN